MGWFDKILQRFTSTASSRKQGRAIPSLAEHNIHVAAGAGERDRREVRPLCDVKSYAESAAIIVSNSAEIEAFIQALDLGSAAELKWRNSPCYPAPYIAELSNITVIPGSKLLLDSEGRALSDEIELGFRHFGLRPKRWDMEVSAGAALSFPLLPLCPLRIFSGIHLMGEHEENYFHWIVEILPRLYVYEGMVHEKSLPVLVSDELNANLYELLEVIRAPERPVVKLKKEMSYYVKHLLYPAEISRILDVYDRAPGDDTTYLPVSLLKAMAGTIKDKLKTATCECNQRLFIKRLSSYRKLLNESEVEDFLVSRGFVAIDPGALSVGEQISIFSQATIVVGPSGAAMANMLWCQPGTRIVVFHPDHPFKKYPYWDALARVSDAEIFYVAGQRTNSISGIFEVHDDYFVDLKVLESLL